jgi:hypothetical protein
MFSALLLASLVGSKHRFWIRSTGASLGGIILHLSMAAGLCFAIELAPAPDDRPEILI